MRLIDEAEVIKRMHETMDYQDTYLPIHFEMCMSDVDAVEVVRCKDCKHWHEDVANFITSIPRGGCKLVRGLTNGDFFCALGERK